VVQERSLAWKQGKPVELYCVFMSGPGIVGKSHVSKINPLRYSQTAKTSWNNRT